MADLGAVIRAWRCRRLAAALVDYSDGTLAAGGRARVERHLAGCARCAEAVAALSDVPAALRATAPLRDDAFWAAQRRRVMHALRDGDAPPARAPLRALDWRLALPVVAAAAIAVAGYVSLRPPSAPGAVALDTLPPEDLAALVEVAGGLVAPHDLLPDAHAMDGAVGGAIEAGWISAADLPAPTGWGDLDADDLDTLDGMLG
jgi:anti-sigma factor RsiW